MDAARIEAIWRFWFGEPAGPYELLPDRMRLWFGKDPEVDREIRDRFGGDVERALAGAYDAWAASPRGRLALILLLDQFTRNIHRDTPRAFAGDPKALALALEGMERGHDRALWPFPRAFFYLPLEHAEDPAIQDRSVEAFHALAAEVPPEHRAPLASFADYADRHAEIVHRFGRFPHRNRILGRQTTPEEAAFLQQPGSSF